MMAALTSRKYKEVVEKKMKQTGFLPESVFIPQHQVHSRLPLWLHISSVVTLNYTP